MLKTTLEGEHFVHKRLWKVVQRQLEYAANNSTGAFYDHLAAMVFAFHALEAYMNFVGDRLAPDFWKDEREHFRSTGFQGKLKKIFELCSISEPNKSDRPYRTILELKRLRDLMVHAKIEKFSQVVEHDQGNKPGPYQTDIDLIVTSDNAQRAAEDVRSFVDMIHGSAAQIVDDIGNTAFDGIIRVESRLTTAV